MSDSLDKQQVDQLTRHLLHISQHNRMVIGLGGRVQDVVAEMRAAVGLEAFGWNDFVHDYEFGQCSVHVEDCEGQHTHPDVVAVGYGTIIERTL